jgi:hypothetical protein
MARRFHLRQAEALLTSLEVDLRQAMSLRDELAQVVSGLAGVARHVSLSGGALLHQDQVADARARQSQLTDRLKQSIEAVHQYGCQIKDLETGLIDFPTTFQGREVYLCWKFGERGIRFWHEVSDGFRGRKPIDEHFLENHRGDTPDQ